MTKQQQKKRITIFVEGKGDICFLKDLIKEHFQMEFKQEKKLLAIFEQDNKTIQIRVFDNKNGGIDHKKIQDLMETIRENELSGGENYVIIDADEPRHKPNGGATKRKEFFKKQKQEKELNFEFFLIPNDKTDGNLEVLLDSIIGDKGKAFYKCLCNYVRCLEGLSSDDRPVRLKNDKVLDKKKFEWYVYMMLDESEKTTLANRDYTQKIWNLHSESLTPLIDFLKKALG